MVVQCVHRLLQVGDLLLKFPEVKAAENYRRDLDLDTAIARVRYSVAYTWTQATP